MILHNINAGDMMARKNIPDAKNRILQAAVKIFAEKSFEGSRIDEIANEANVPKSLIYYHFKNKDEILEVLIETFINEYVEIIKTAEKATHEEKKEQIPDRLKYGYKDFAQKNADLIRIILIDSLKKSTEKPVVFKLVEALIETEERFSMLSKTENYNRNERLVAEFFTSILPNCAYLCFAEPWVKYFSMDKTEFDELFVKIIAETHGSYHKNHS